MKQQTLGEKLATEIENSSSWFKLIGYALAIVGLAALKFSLQGLVLFSFLYALRTVFEVPQVTFWQCCLLMFLGQMLTGILLPKPKTKND